MPGVAHMVERWFPTPEVAGSNPVPRREMIKVNLKGKVVWEYCEDGSKCHDLYILLKSGKKIPLNLRSFNTLTERNGELIYRVRSNNSNWKEVTQTKLDREVVSFLKNEGYEVQEIDEGHYEI